MSFKLKIKGVKETLRFLKRKESDTENGVSKGLREVGFFLEGEIKSSIAGRKSEPTSVDSGQFMNSVTSEAGKDDVVVKSDVGHSKFLEFGTSRMSARSHFRNSIDRNRNKIENFLEREIK